MKTRLQTFVLWPAAAWLATGAATSTARATLIAHYDFNESAGPTLNDSAGAADGTAADVTFVPSGAGAPGNSGLGNAGSFAGSTTSNVGFGSGAHPASFDLGTGDFTIAGWLKTPTNFENFDRPVFQSTSFQGGGWSLEVGRADRSRRGKVYLTVGGGSATEFANTQAYSDARLDDDAWHWVAVMNSGGAISMYVDGVQQLDTGVMVATSSATAPTATEAYFGKFGSLHFGGQLDDWRIYDHALSGTLSGTTLTGGELFDAWQTNVVVPEPAGLSAAGVAMLGLALRRRRSR